ncbi:MAG: hypothetical protein JNL25_17715 [Rhodospirillaceae bacterium]|nr:hypothetical protein [Rhodospirillaceae bacterium]
MFRKVAHVIGPGRLAELWHAHRSESRPEARDPRAFAAFLAGRDVCRAYPALADLARLDLGLFLAGMDDREPSIGACCLPADLIESHPDLMLRLQPSFRYLSLSYPVHHWVATETDLPKTPADQRILLRLAPDRSSDMDTVLCEILPPARFAFESSLARGRTLGAAMKLATMQDPAFDGTKGVASLIEDGAIADVILHAKL